MASKHGRKGFNAKPYGSSKDREAAFTLQKQAGMVSATSKWKKASHSEASSTHIPRETNAPAKSETRAAVDTMDAAEAVQASTTTYKSKLRTKVVVRFLPPTLKEEEFWDSIEEKYKPAVNWQKFVSGRKEKLGRGSCNTVAYLNFDSVDQAEDFRKSYHGHVFSDENHHLFRAVVCIAPFQRIPRKVEDRRENTYEKDATYLSFMEQLEEKKGAGKIPSPSNANMFPLLDEDGEPITPLLIALHDKHGVSTKVGGRSYTYSTYVNEFASLPKNEAAVLKSSTEASTRKQDLKAKDTAESNLEEHSNKSLKIKSATKHRDRVKDRTSVGKQETITGGSDSITQRTTREDVKKLESEIDLLPSPEFDKRPDASDWKSNAFHSKGVWKSLLRGSGDVALKGQAERKRNDQP